MPNNNEEYTVSGRKSVGVVIRKNHFDEVIIGKYAELNLSVVNSLSRKLISTLITVSLLLSSPSITTAMQTTLPSASTSFYYSENEDNVK